MMKRVPESEVVRHWLARDATQPDGGTTETPTTPERLVGDLLSHNPDAGSLFWKHDIDWYRTTLSEAEFESLRVIDGPPDSDWQRATPDGTVSGVARRIRRGEAVPVDDEKIREMRTDADSIAGEGLILFRRNEFRTPHVVDGNHRATALALDLLEGGEYRPVDAYLGVKTASVTRSAFQQGTSVGALLPARARASLEKIWFRLTG